MLIYCSQLIYNGIAYPGALGTIVSAPLNAASATTSGLDFQADYTMRLFTGSLDWHLVGNYTDEQTETAVGTKTDYANSIGPDSPVSGFPKFRTTLVATYSEGPWSATVQGRFIGAAALDNGWGPLMVDDNHVPFMSYLDLRASYKWTGIGHGAIGGGIGIAGNGARGDLTALQHLDLDRIPELRAGRGIPGMAILQCGDVSLRNHNCNRLWGLGAGNGAHIAARVIPKIIGHDWSHEKQLITERLCKSPLSLAGIQQSLCLSQQILGSPFCWFPAS